MATVELNDLKKTYPNGFQAVKGIDLAIKDGEFIVLVGPSGCGKSTTLRMVAGLEEITDGTIQIGERTVNTIAPKDRDIAMVFQNYALYPHMTVYKNMAFGLKLRKTPNAKIDEQVRSTAKILDIEHLLDRKPKQLSGGQRQRVAVGRAIVRDPACFLFDEPLSNLDAKLRVEMRAELKRLHRQLKTTTIYVTHDQEEAMTLGDRVVVMDEGYIQQCDTPLNVYLKPVNRFVGSFLGTPPMNFIEGELQPQAGQLCFVGEDITLPLTDDHAALLSGQEGKPVVMGIRPESLSLCDTPDESTLQLSVDVVELLGDRMDVSCSTSTGHILNARLKAQNLQEASTIALRVDRPSVHLFEPGKYGKNLTLAESAQ